MKLTSRSLKIGDKIIRIAPNKDGQPTFMSSFCEIIKKSPYYTEVKVYWYPGDPSPNSSILNHHTWDDNFWVRFK